MKQFIGKQFAHYQLNALLGEGGMGVVYHALNLQSGHPVAVKIMLANLTNKPLYRQRFAQEAQTISTFNSPAIIKMYDTGQFEETPYLAMEYVEGGNLTGYLKQLQWSSKQMPLNELITLGAQIMEGLAYAHQRGIIHRDIKPDNILLKLRNGGNGTISQAIISDFGLALKLKRGDELATNPFMGSLAYMSPEQCQNMPFDGRSDIYSAGIMLYQLATGQLPFKINAPVDIIKHVEEPPLPPNLINPELPQAIEDIILKAIAKKPSARFQTAAEMAHALRRASRDISVLTAVPYQQRSSEVTRWLGDKWVAGVNVQDRVDMNKTWITEGSYRLFVTNQYEESQTFSLNKDEITVGRSHDNDIVLQDQAISAHHISLKRTMAGWQLRDLGSTNGTYIDDRAMEFNQDVAWKQHEVLRIGPYFLKWQRFDDGENRKSQPSKAGVPLTPSNGRQNGSHQNGKPNGYAALPLATMAPPPALSGGQAVPPPILQSATPPPISVDNPVEPLEPLYITGSESAVLHVTVTPDTIELTPEIELPIAITIVNRDTVVKDISVRLFDGNGRHPHWARLMQQGQRLLPRETAIIQAEIELPQNHNLLAGDHVLNVQVTTDRGETAVTPIRLIISPQQAFTLDMHPSNLEEGVICRLAINDQSNFDNEYTIVGTDDRDGLLFNFRAPQDATLIDNLDSDPHQQQLKLAAGANAQASFTLRPRKRPWLSRKQVYPFKVHVQTQNPNKLQTEIGQVRINPRISLKVFLLFLILLLALGGVIAYIRITSQREINNLLEQQAAAQEAADEAAETAAAKAVEADEATTAAEAAQNAVAAAIAEGKSPEEIAALEAAAAAAVAEETDAIAASVAAEAEADAAAEAAEAAAAEAAAVAEDEGLLLLPNGIELDVTDVEENSPANTVIGVFTTKVGESASIDSNTIIATSRKREFLTKQQRQTGAFTYSLASGGSDNAAFIIDGNQLKSRIAFDFETQNQYNIRVQTSDSNGEVFEQSFTISVSDANDAPAFSSLPLITAQEDVLYSYSVLATDPDSRDTAVITASSKPSWLTLVANGSNALLSGTPTNEDIGDHTVTLLTTDSSGETDTQTFTITVANVNNSPVFDSNNAPAPAATEDIPYSHPLVASDPDADDTLTISIQNSPSWLTLTNNSNGKATLSGTPTNDDVATYALNLRVTDSAGATGTQVLNITVSNVNDAPTFTSVPVENVQPTKPYTYNIRADDVDVNDNLTIIVFSPSPLPTGLTFQDNGDGTATLSGTLDNDGTHNINLRVTDSVGATGAQTFTLVVEDVNDAPVIDDAQTTLTIPEDAANSALVGKIIAIDADNNDTLTYKIISGNSSNAFTLNNDEIRVADTSQLDFETAALKSFALEIRVTDDGIGNLTDIATFTINITDVDDEKPIITPETFSVDKNAPDGTLVGTGLTATDVDSAPTDLNSWTIIMPPAVPLAINSTSGQLTINGTLDPLVLSYKFDVTVSDGNNNVSLPVEITVNILNNNVAPVLDVNAELSLSDIVEDLPVLNNNGNTVAEILASFAAIPDPIADQNIGDPEGIAVISVDNTNGIWEFRHGTWQSFPLNISETSAVVLGLTDSIRFLPNPDYHTAGTTFDSIGFRAWDRSLGTTPGTLDIDTSTNGGSTPFSGETDTIIITVTSVLDDPIADDFSGSTEEDTLLSVDVLSNVSDGDSEDKLTITITGVLSGTAVVDDGGTPTDPIDDKVDFTPAQDFFGTASFTYTVNDGNTDSNEATVTIDVTPVNDPPIIGAVDGTTVTYPITATEPITLAVNGTVIDVDLGVDNFDNGTLTITIIDGVNGDQLTIVSDNVIRAKTSPDTVQYNTATLPSKNWKSLGTYAGGTGTTPLEINITNDKRVTSEIQALLQHIAFETTDTNIGTRTVEFVLTDGDGGTSDTVTMTVNVGTSP